MNMQMNAPDHITSLATSAVLVSVEVSVWTGSITDDSIRDEVVQSKQAKKNAASVSKHIMADCPEHKALKSFRTSISNGLQNYCYPWAGNLWALPMSRYQAFMVWFEERKVAHAKLLAELKAVYPDYVRNQAFQSTGLMFNINDYPSVDELDRRFTLDLVQVPVPENDWRVQINSDLASDLHTHYTRQAERMTREIAEKQSKDFMTIVQRLHNGLGYSEKTDDNGMVTVKRNKLVDTTFQKCIDLIDTFKGFNPSNSLELEEARQMLEDAMKGYTLDDLRDNDTARNRVSADVGAVLSKFGVKK